MSYPLEVTRSQSGVDVLIKLAGGHLLADGLILSPEQARTIARHLITAASEAELAARLILERAGPAGREA